MDSSPFRHFGEEFEGPLIKSRRTPIESEVPHINA